MPENRIKRFEEYRENGYLATGLMLNDLAEHIERLEKAVHDVDSEVQTQATTKRTVYIPGVGHQEVH